MKIGPYAVTAEGIYSLALHVGDSLRVRVAGIPALRGDNPVEIASEVLRRNARKVLWAGSGHFRFMWVSDFGKALRGAEKVLPLPYLRDLIERMIRISRKLGRVPSCFGARGFDAPYWRGDNLPWLVIAAAEYCRWTGLGLSPDNARSLQWLLDDYCRRHFHHDGLLDDAVTGDWMDTIMRPSSTYNNVCVLRMLQDAAGLGLDAPVDPVGLESDIIRVRWRGDHFVDCAEGDAWGVDAAVFALYFGLFKKDVREALIRRMEASGLLKPYPMRANAGAHEERRMPPLTKFTPGYHSAIWPHLGLAYLNGLKRAGKDYASHKAAVEALVMKHRNFVETLTPEGGLYTTWAHSTEHGLSMAAGQYLELALD